MKITWLDYTLLGLMTFNFVGCVIVCAGKKYEKIIIPSVFVTGFVEATFLVRFASPINEHVFQFANSLAGLIASSMIASAVFIIVPITVAYIIFEWLCDAFPHAMRKVAR